MSESREEKPSIIGRDRFLMESLAKVALAAVKKRHEYTPLRQTRRGYSFEVRVLDVDGEPTGHVASVTVELERVDEERSS